MNPFLVNVISTLIRQLLIFVAGAIGLTPLLNEYMSDVEKFSASAAIVVLTVGYALYRKYKDRQKLVTALAAASMTEAEAKARVKDPEIYTPSVTTPKDQVPA